MRQGERETLEGFLDWYRVFRNAPSLDALSARETSYREQVSLRWIMVHMVEETARHAGHLDLMREKIDGQVGD